MKKTSSTALIIVALASVITLPAAAKKLNPWQDCGIGAMVFPDNGAAAAISNIIWDLGTTAVTTQASSKDSCASSNAKTAMFIKATMPALEQDVAAGEGEYVTAMLELRGCEATSHNAIIEAIRTDVANTQVDSAEKLYNIVEQRVTSNFSAACTNV